MTVHVLGIRHHGPGSARAVVAALDALRPDAVLIEGPADADALLPWVADPDMVPPVALLAYTPDEPRAVFWPFAVFSPEWQALTWAARHGVAVRFCDLPSTAVLARAAAVPGDTPDPDAPDPDDPLPDDGPASDTPAPDDAGPEQARARRVRTDPLAVLAAAGGYDDPERWWEDLVEQRGFGPDRARSGDTGADGPEPDDAGPDGTGPDGTGPDHATALAPFEALTEAMAAVRESAPPQPVAEQAREDRREAYMRRTLRETLKGGAQRVAVVCGAWHAPALAGSLPPASRDNALLRGLPRQKTALSWVPWSHSRLATASGYGAGVTSPGWYHHLFTTPEQPVVTWLTRVAGVLRAEDLPVSSAHVIEAVRLAEALAGLRGRPLAGLAEVTEATRAVLVEGDETMLALVTDRMVVGEALGAIPDAAPTVPLAADLTARARRLRLKQEPGERALDLDLRRAIDLDRSRLFHRLTALGVAWAVPRDSDVQSTGTFREVWSLRWRPELAVSLVEASTWGTTVEAAAGARLEHDAARATTLAPVTAAVETCLLADLPDVLPALLTALDARAAADLDVVHLMDALPALVRTVRYGDVRGTDVSAAGRVADALAVRICAALPAAATGLDDDGAAQLRTGLDAVHEAVALRAGSADADRRGAARWFAVLDVLAERTDVHGLLAGRCARLVRDAGHGDPTAAARRFSAALSRGADAPARAAFVEGFLAGGGLLLVHDADLLALLDEWLTGLTGDDFTETLPMLRRTFATFADPERRGIGERVRGGARPDVQRADEIDERRAAAAVATAARLLGVGA